MSCALLLQPLQGSHDKLPKLKDAVEQHHASNRHTYKALHDSSPYSGILINDRTGIAHNAKVLNTAH